MPQHFYELFSSAVDQHANRIAIEFQRRDGLDQLTYAELREMAERTAAWLSLIGIAPGDRCAIFSDNHAHWCAAYLGILRCGAVAVPLDTAYKASQVETLLRDSGARVIFTSARYLPAVLEARARASSDIRLVMLHGEAEAGVSFEAMTRGRMPAPPLPTCPATPSDPAVTLYTSGTTSDPKGVVLTHGNLIAERTGVFETVTVTDRDCVLGVLPLFHALAQMANLLLPLSAGARVVFLESVNTTELLRALRERGVTMFACVPQFFYLIHQRVADEVGRRGGITRAAFRTMRRFSIWLRGFGINMGPLLFRRIHAILGGRMRVMVTGGSKFDPQIGADFHAMGFDLLQAYGLTETSGAATLMRPGDGHLETVGHPLPGVEVRIGPPEAGEAAATDGEVLIRGPVVMQGYFNRPDATAAALQDHWLHTGDLGRLDADGRLLITGRRKELIVLSSGKNIYPEEIEAAYRASPFVKEICVLGLSRPGEPAAERLYAVVVPNQELLRERKVANVGDLMRFEMEGASIHLPHHKRVLGYEIWMDPLPRTTTGKIRRFEVERRVRDATAKRDAPQGSEIPAADQAWLARPELEPILELIRKAARPGTSIVPDANLEMDLGLDSMERVELLTGLEQRFASDIPEEQLHQLYTVRELSEAILAHSQGDGGEAGATWAALLAPSAINPASFESWMRPHWFVPTILLGVLKILVLAVRPGARIDRSGINNLPASGAYLISPNHQSFLDPFVLIATLPFRVVRRLFFVAASEYFGSPLLGWLARQVNLVPVDPDAGLIPAMQAGAFGLRQGRVLVLFPEGERTIDGTVKSFKKGAAILSHHLDVPIVPVAIDGAFEIWPRNRPLDWRRLLPGAGTRVKVVFGEPVRSGASTNAPHEEAYSALTARLRGTVETMWRRAHGVNAQPPTPNSQHIP
jgi:long-chain acyl-CoA synthetase